MIYSRSQTYGYALTKSRVLGGALKSSKRLSSVEIDVQFTERQIYKVHLNVKYPRKCNWFIVAAKSSCHSSSYFTECTRIEVWHYGGEMVCSFACPTTDKVLIKGASPLSGKIWMARLYVDIWLFCCSWIPWNLSFCYIHCTGQFTPKMKANAEPRLLSYLVWFDSGIVVSQHRLESFFMK